MSNHNVESVQEVLSNVAITVTADQIELAWSKLLADRSLRGLGEAYKILLGRNVTEAELRFHEEILGISIRKTILAIVLHDYLAQASDQEIEDMISTIGR